MIFILLLAELVGSNDQQKLRQLYLLSIDKKNHFKGRARISNRMDLFNFIQNVSNWN